MKRRTVTPSTEVLTPHELEKLLNAAQPSLRAPIALAAFTGMQADESERVSIEDIDLASGRIRIQSSWSRRYIDRTVRIPTNLRPWLERYLPEAGPVCRLKSTMRRIANLAVQLGMEWEPGVLRRSFTCYFLALESDAAKVALEIGTSAVFLRLWGWPVANEKTAKEWFGIMPSQADTTHATMTTTLTEASDQGIMGK
jgi:integrase